LRRAEPQTFSPSHPYSSHPRHRAVESRGQSNCLSSPTTPFAANQGWVERAGRFRSLGDGQVDFGAVFSKMTANNFDGWAVVEWECALKHPEDGAREGAEFVAAHIIRVTEKAFDDFAAGGTDQAANRRMLGLS
ncbi:sugar phosphate isomerase/epimerase family protein, partial [Rhizobium leguminosarum]|uniref:sugar phosphate isomerase/epimerase family protein n=1 Tax=Rhizobium leguminosarum TaxID=384 RepID=UPI00391CDD6F